MNRSVAARLVREREASLEALGYEELVRTWLNRSECEQVLGADGVEYQIEIEGFWDDPDEQRLFRLVLSIDDGRGWRALVPLMGSGVLIGPR